MKLKPLMMMRTRGLMGTIAHGYANLQNHVAKPSGFYFGAGGGGSASFCVKDLAFSDDPIAYIECTKPPTLGAVDTYGTIKVNGLPVPWVVDDVQGNRIYFTTTPPLLTGDVVTYSYDPILDGGITDSAAEQLCAMVDAPFTEIPTLGFVTHLGEIVTHNGENVTHTGTI